MSRSSPRVKTNLHGCLSLCNRLDVSNGQVMTFVGDDPCNEHRSEVSALCTRV